MAQLNGEVIERLLFEEGFEFEIDLDRETMLKSLKITGGNATVTLSEIWEEEDNWYVDTFSLDLVGEIGNIFVDMTTDPIYDEFSLVQRIVEALGNEIEITREIGNDRIAKILED